MLSPPFIPVTPFEQKVSDYMVTAWTNFIKGQLRRKREEGRATGEGMFSSGNTPALDGSEAPSSCDLADSTTDPGAFRWIVPHSKLAEQTPEFEHPWCPGKFPCRISYKRLQCDRPIWHGEVVLTASAVGVKVRQFEPGTAGC